MSISYHNSHFYNERVEILGYELFSVVTYVSNISLHFLDYI